MKPSSIKLQASDKDLIFTSCEGCGALCCQSNIIYASVYDIDKVAKYFPLFFLITENKISLVYFFYYGEKEGRHCPYLKNDLCSIYEERPYACRTYPFTNKKGAFYYDGNCPHIVKNEPGLNIIKDSNINSSIVDDFINEEFLLSQDQIMHQSEEFVHFCKNNDLLIPFNKHYKDREPYTNFKPSMQQDLYLIHPFKIAALRLNKQKLFDNKKYFLYLVQLMIKSQENIVKLHAKV